jgi:hypothetical protein
MENRKQKGNAVWPTIDSIQTAREAAQQGFWAAIAVAVITSIAILAAMALGGALGPLDLGVWAFIDVGIYVAIAIGIRRMSRVAAVLGLVLYIANRIYLWAVLGARPAGIAMTAILVIALLNGVRGTFAYHRLRKQGIEETLADGSDATLQETTASDDVQDTSR